MNFTQRSESDIYSSMVKSKKIKVVLIGDTHPEMIALSKELQAMKVDYRIFLSFYLTKPEFQKITNRKLLSKKIEEYLSKRILSTEIESQNLIRDFAFFELLILSLDLAGFVSVRNFFTKIALKIRQNFLSIYLLIVKPQVVIAYDNIRLRVPKSSQLIVIALMAHPLEVQSVLAKAESDYPRWPKTDGNLNYNHSQIYTRANRVIVLSNYAYLSFIEYGVPAEKLKTINIGPKNQNSLEFQNLAIRRNERTNVLFVGQINLRKGVPAIIDAASELRLTHEFKIVGPSLNSKISDFLTKSNLPNNIIFVVNPSQKQLSFEFGQAEVFVFPSYSEGFSLACIEAMSYGLIPVLSKNSGVFEALVNTGLEDFSINPGSAENIVEKLSSIRDLPDEEFYKFRKLSATISKNYSLDKFARELLSVMDLN